MSAPDFLPVLSRGAHTSPKAGACAMEYVSFLAGEEWSDSPACVHPVIAAMARSVNDRLGDEERQTLLPLLARTMGTAPTGTDEEQCRLSVALAVWSAEQVTHQAQTAATRAARAAAACAARAAAAHQTFAAAAYAGAAAADPSGLLSGLLDEYDRLTGRTERPALTDDDLRRLAALTA